MGYALCVMSYGVMSYGVMSYALWGYELRIKKIK